MSSSVVNQAAREVVAAADPRVRQIIAEERERVARALAESFSFGGIGVLAALGTRYYVPSGTGQALGYGAAVILGGVAAWRLWSGLRAPPAPPEDPDGSTLIRFVEPVVNQFATAVVREAEPRIRAIVEDEKAKFEEAAKVAVPAVAGAAASYLGTSYLVPDRMKLGKVAGYGLAATLLFYSIYRMVWSS